MNAYHTSLRAAMKSAHCEFASPPTPSANYVAIQRAGSLLYVSGHIATDSQGTPILLGRLDESISLQDGYRAARLCAIAILSNVSLIIEDNIERIKQVQRLGVFIACSAMFTEHSKVANGASDVMTDVLGPPDVERTKRTIGSETRGHHARTAVGVSSLPCGACVEVDAIFEIEY
jgi:enamine deaminase RidA (YjgF/YER057c/UK114 family)